MMLLQETLIHQVCIKETHCSEFQFNLTMIVTVSSSRHTFSYNDGPVHTWAEATNVCPQE